MKIFWHLRRLTVMFIFLTNPLQPWSRSDVASCKTLRPLLNDGNETML